MSINIIHVLVGEVERRVKKELSFSTFPRSSVCEIFSTSFAMTSSGSAARAG